MTLWIYGVLDQSGTDRKLWLLPVVGLVQVAAGFVIGSWGAVVLPLLLVPISVPAGDPPIRPDNAEPFPIFFSVGFGAIFAVPLVAVGLAARMIYESRAASSNRGERGSPRAPESGLAAASRRRAPRH